MAATKKGGAAKKAVKKAAPKAAVKKTVVKKTTTKKAAPKGATKKAKAKAKKATSVKLSLKQIGALKLVHEKGEIGYIPGKGEARSLDSLVVKKLLKRGAKNKATGAVPYHLTKLGHKHATAPAPAPTS